MMMQYQKSVAQQEPCCCCCCACLKPDFCPGGYCRNTEGGAECECPRGWDRVQDQAGTFSCRDGREEKCFQEYRSR